MTASSREADNAMFTPVAKPDTCPLCLPRPDDSSNWLIIRKLSISTLYLDRNQTYRGHCQLVFDARHAVGLEDLSTEEFTRMMLDLQRAAGAIARTCQPDRMNYAALGNLVPHLHWHLVPRYRTDPRWGLPIYTSAPSDMSVTHLTEAEYRDTVRALDRELDNTPT